MIFGMKVEQAGRAALHAIAGALLGGVNGVDGAIKAAIGAGVSTAIAPYINDIVKNAVAQSGLKGGEAKRLSDIITSSLITGLLAGASGTDLAAYASNEIKYNFLTNSQQTALGKEQADVLDKLVRCQNGGQCSDEEILGLLEKIQDLYAEGAQESIDNINKLVSSCSDNVSSPTCQSLRKELDDSIEAGVTDPRLMGIKSSNNTILYDPDIDLDQMLQEIDVGKRPSSDLKKYFTPDVLEKEYTRIYESNEYVQTMRSTIAGLVLALRGGRTSPKVSTSQNSTIANGRGASFANEFKLQRHFKDHGSYFGAKNIAEYVKQADRFLTGPLRSTTLQKIRSNGDIIRYDTKTQEFGVITKDDVIRSYYKPDPKIHHYPSNKDYFNAL